MATGKRTVGNRNARAPAIRPAAAILEELLPDATATAALGARLAAALQGGIVVTLSGELGAGKTTLVRGLLRAFGVSGPIKSPSYALLEVYEVLSIYFYHFDFYRVRRASELDHLGVREYFRPDSICLIEWPERAAAALPPADLAIEISYHGDGRRVRLAARTAAGESCLARYTASGRSA